MPPDGGSRRTLRVGAGCVYSPWFSESTTADLDEELRSFVMLA